MTLPHGSTSPAQESEAVPVRVTGTTGAPGVQRGRLPPLARAALAFLQRRSLGRIGSHLQRLVLQQQYRYLVTGCWNAGCGWLFFYLGWWLFGARVHYLVLSAVVNEIAVLNSFLGQRYFVFGGSEDGMLIDLGRFHVVYAAGLLVILVQMWVLVSLCHLHPVLAMTISLVLTAVVTYLAHKLFTFRSMRRPMAVCPPPPSETRHLP